MAGSISVEQSGKSDARKDTGLDSMSISDNEADRFAALFRPSWHPPEAAAPTPGAPPEATRTSDPEVGLEIGRLAVTRQRTRATVSILAAVGGFSLLVTMGITSSLGGGSDHPSTGSAGDLPGNSTDGRLRSAQTESSVSKPAPLASMTSSQAPQGRQASSTGPHSEPPPTSSTGEPATDESGQAGTETASPEELAFA